jgi:hypothetical protein
VSNHNIGNLAGALSVPLIDDRSKDAACNISL